MDRRRIRMIFGGLVITGMIGLGSDAWASQAGSAASPLAGCGPEETQFSTSHGEVGDVSAPEAADKATVYVIELFNLKDKGRFNRPTIRVGMDGAWTGATQGFSFLRFAAGPGTRHVCARWQSRLGSLSQQVSLFNFDAQAGKTYYLRVQITIEGGGDGGGPASIDLAPVSEDEGRFLVSQAARSVSHPK